MNKKESRKRGGAKSAGVGLVLVLLVGALAGYGLFGFLNKKAPSPGRTKRAPTKILRKPMPELPREGAALEMKIEAPVKKAAPKAPKPAATAPKAVKKEAPKLAAKPKPEPKVAPRAGTGDIYVVQVGAFRSEDAAKKLSQKLAKDGFRTFINAWTHPRYGEMYRIRVGPMMSREEAIGTRDRLTEKGFKPFIVKNP